MADIVAHYLNNHFVTDFNAPFQIEDQSVQLEALDILADLLSRFGGNFLHLFFHPCI